MRDAQNFNAAHDCGAMAEKALLPGDYCSSQNIINGAQVSDKLNNYHQ